ncbi:acyltransferase [Kordiimonas sp. SCSIO 12610]|uniref:acyltransferase family protein n=1 Tax=Kordiimonas sp. SCSIO 12610 TaxID=2829597 RepID=UPI00210C6ABC|nr:acyltransferase [Kordiimonas sp. SCSIO 12610]UTW56304.1 acyltransferase [Kordiimonas sp. SCSIO 12610]
MTFLDNVHRFRGIAIFCIVAAHSLHNFNWPEGSLILTMIDSLMNQSSVWFFFIAGYLFQHLSKGYETKRYFKTKIRNVITPYLIVSIPALIASLTFFDQSMPDGFSDYSLPIQIGLFLISGQHLAPFWFVPTIALLYLLAPLLIKSDRLGWPYYSLIVLIPLSFYLGRDGVLIHFGLNGYFGALSKAMYLFPAYYFGMFCSHHRETITALTNRAQIPLLLLAVLAYALTALGAIPELSPIFIFKLSTALLLLVWINKIHFPRFSHIDLVADLSFGIFFVHGYFLAATKLVLSYAGTASGMLPASLPLYLAFTVMVTILSVLSLVLVKRLTGKSSRLIIGC